LVVSPDRGSAGFGDDVRSGNAAMRASGGKRCGLFTIAREERAALPMPVVPSP
jgi:hypothetical protein